MKTPIIDRSHSLFEPMPHSQGFGRDLFQSGRFGGGEIFFPAGKGVPKHSHPGAHWLWVLEGRGTLGYDGLIYPLSPNVEYFVAPNIEHFIQANTDLVLKVIGNNYHSATDPNRLILT